MFSGGSSLVQFVFLFFAYLDPGSGSFILQILIAGLLGFILSAKIFWTRIVAFFTGSTPADAQDTDESNNDAG